MNIIEQFPDVDEDVKQIMEDNKAIETNNEFASVAMNSDLVRKNVVMHYNTLLKEDKD